MATFALLLKACQKDISFVDAHCVPRVLDMPHCNLHTWEELKGHLCCTLGLSCLSEKINKELDAAFQLLDDAETLGSIMKFGISEETRTFMMNCIKEQTKQHEHKDNFRDLFAGFEMILTLTNRYSALVMNPPYMGGGNMNNVLSKYVKDNYPNSKSDLMTVFMEVCKESVAKDGKFGMINLPSWLFLSSFESLRKGLISNYHIDTLIHMGRGIFGIDWGSVAFTVSKTVSNKKGVFFRLHKRNFQHIYFEHIGQLFLQVLKNHELRYDFNTYRDKDVTEIKEFEFKNSNDGDKLYFETEQKNFEKIPGSPIGYWVSEKILTRFAGNLALSEVVKPLTGLQTSDNARFVRYWSEVNLKKISFGMKSAEEAKEGGKKWFYYNKGGATRKWFGNHELVVNWENDGVEIKHTKASVVRNPTYYFKKSISWSLTSSVGNAFRYNPDAAIFDVNGMSLFIFDSNNIYFLLGCLNTKIYQLFANIINPTLALQCGDVAGFPSPMDVDNNTKSLVSIRAEENYQISLQDWDAHETSWDFQSNEIVALNNDEKYADTMNEIYEGTGMKVDLADSQLNSLEWRTHIIKQKWERKFMQLHANEEELNRQFIDIYGLQDELIPNVPLDEITILQQGEISIENNAIVWHDDVLIKQLISYAVGCMMGRYSIDKSGLILANQGDGLEEYKALVPNSRFKIDDDGIIPIMPANTEFTDNITLRFKTWLSTVFGENSLIENLNYIEKSLGKRLDDYFVKDFWKYHKKMYQNRPIYWLFSSKKGAFQCIVYMHRMNAYTAEKVRTNYLLPHIEWLINKQSEMQANAADLSTRERKEMDNIGKQIEECREYHDRLHAVADKPIAFDLDDGVVVNYAKFGDVLMKLK